MDALPNVISAAHLRENLATYLDQVVDDRNVIIIRRRGSRSVAMIALEELDALLKTAKTKA